MVGTRDAVVFDEIANTDFTDPKALVSRSCRATCRTRSSAGARRRSWPLPPSSWSATWTCRASCRTRSTITCSSRCRTSSRSRRSSTGSTPTCRAGRSPRSAPDSLSQDYGFITDYFCEIMHELRRVDVLGGLRSRFGWSRPHRRARGSPGVTCGPSRRSSPGLLKLLYPHGEVDDEQVGRTPLAGRRGAAAGPQPAAPDGPRRVRAGRSGGEAASGCPARSSSRRCADAQRVSRSSCRARPLVGEVIGLAVIGDDQGVHPAFRDAGDQGASAASSPWARCSE